MEEVPKPTSRKPSVADHSMGNRTETSSPEAMRMPLARSTRTGPKRITMRSAVKRPQGHGAHERHVAHLHQSGTGCTTLSKYTPLQSNMVPSLTMLPKAISPITKT